MSKFKSIISANFKNDLMNFVSGAVPYSTADMIDFIEVDNPKYKDFYTKGTRREELLHKNSISQGNMFGINNSSPIAQFGSDGDYFQFMYATIDPDKGKRLREYRLIAAYPQVSSALDEICDEFIVSDADDKIFQFDINNDIDKNSKRELVEEFYKFVDIYDFQIKGWEYCRNYLVDGEIYFENIIHEESKDKGILGVISVPAEDIDPIYDNVQNLMIKGYLLRKKEYEKSNKQFFEIKPIIFDKNQMSYFHSNEWDEKKKFRVPVIEKARRPYKQLSLLEDSIIIHRLVNAPEKMVFNIDVGNMPQPQADRYIHQLAQNYWNRKTYDNTQGGVNMVNPPSMLDAYWFPKRAGSEGTTVNKLKGDQNLGDLPDLDYFVNLLYHSLHVPSNRLNPQSRFSDGTDIIREELSFAKFIMRIQQHFSETVKDNFITHLKLRGWWDEYQLKERQLKVKMNPPTHFHVMREQQIFEIKSNNYSGMAQNELISDTFAQKNYLELDDKKILQNRHLLRKDAEFKWELTQIEQLGPEWKQIQKNQTDAASQDFGSLGGGGGGIAAPVGDTGLPDTDGEEADTGDAASSTPPDFGPAPDTSPQNNQNQSDNINN